MKVSAIAWANYVPVRNLVCPCYSLCHLDVRLKGAPPSDTLDFSLALEMTVGNAQLKPFRAYLVWLVRGPVGFAVVADKAEIMVGQGQFHPLAAPAMRLDHAK